MDKPAGTTLSFKLHNGRCGTLAPEAQRTYEAIVANGQVKTVLSKSRLQESSIDRIWLLTEQIDAPGRADGTWSQLEVYVTLYFVQAEEKLSLNGMLSQFAGPFSLPSRKITRRSSYAAAPRSNVEPASANASVELPVTPSRSQSVSVSSSQREPSHGDSTSSPNCLATEQRTFADSHLLQRQARHTYQRRPKYHVGTPNLATVEDYESETDQTHQGAKVLPGNSIRQMPANFHPSASKVPPSMCNASSEDSLQPTIAAQVRVPTAETSQNLRDGIVRSSSQIAPYSRTISPTRGSNAPHRLSAPPMRTISGGLLDRLPAPSSAGMEVLENESSILRSLTVTSSSSRGSTAAEKRQRLADLIAVQNQKAVLAPILQAPTSLPRFASYVEECEARNILAANRESLETTSGLGAIFKTKSDKRKAKDNANIKYSKEEYNQALRHAVEHSRPVGVVEALLDCGADANILKAATSSTIKRVRGKDITAIPGNYIQTAALDSQIETVQLLAQRGAWLTSISEALGAAVQRKHYDVIRVLLQHNADPNAGGGNIFREAIALQDTPAVRLLLQARKPVHKDLLSNTLTSAVASRKLDIVLLLVTYGADVNHADASALRKAVEVGQSDLLIALVRGKPSSKAVSLAFEGILAPEYLLSNPEVYTTVDVLLCAGASGHYVDEALVRVVNTGHQKLALLLVDSGASINHEEAKALRVAVRRSSLKLVGILLKGEIEPRFASKAFSEIPQPFEGKLTNQLMSTLLHHGASGESVAKALIVAVSNKLISTATLLLEADVSVYYKDAKALQIAISTGNTGLVTSLLTKRTERPLPLHVLVPLIPKRPWQTYSDLMTCFIRLGLPSPLLHTAFLGAMDHTGHNPDIALIKAFLSAGVDVNRVGGKCLSDAVSTANCELVELLLQHNLKEHFVSSAIPIAMSTTPDDVRLRLVSLLMNHGAKGEPIAHGLKKAFQEEPAQLDLIGCLLQDRTAINLLDGEVISGAIHAKHKRVLEIVLAVGKPSSQSCNNALLATLQPGTHARLEKLRLLSKHGLPSDAVNQALVGEIGNGMDCDQEIIAFLMRSGASCDWENGQALGKAIQANQLNLLQQLTTTGKPSKQTLAQQIPNAMAAENGQCRYSMMKLLLEGCEKGINMNVALLHEISLGQTTDPRLVDHLIRRGAQPAHLDGAAIQAVITPPTRPELLKLLLSGHRVDDHILSSKVPYAMTCSPEARLEVLDLLLNHGASGLPVDVALIQAVAEGDRSLPIIQLLLKHHASVCFQDSRAVAVAASKASAPILLTLLANYPESRPGLLVEAFKAAMQLPILQATAATSSRQEVIELITKTDPETLPLGSALAKACADNDDKLVDHLVIQGADPNYDSGRAVILAAESYNAKILQHLMRKKLASKICSRGFQVIAVHPERFNKPSDFIKMARMLLRAGASGEAVDKCLIAAIRAGNRPEGGLVEVLLDANPGPNINVDGGRPLQLAVRRNDVALVTKLLDKGPDPESLSQAFVLIFESQMAEAGLMAMVQLFYDHAPEDKDVFHSTSDFSRSPLYQCLHRHPDKNQLLQLLVDNGCPVNCTFSWGFVKTIGAEDVSPLLWLLCQNDGTASQDKGASRETIGSLLKRSDVNFRTRKSGMTAVAVAAACANLGIIKDLLAAGADVHNEDHLGRTPLWFAARTGAVRNMNLLIAKGASCNDESLHAAVKHLNVSAVTILLNHKANVDLPGFLASEGRSPLGELCRHGDCEGSPAQVKATMGVLLKASPNLNMVTERRSILYHAIDNPSPCKMTRILLNTCPQLAASINDDVNIYRTEGGRCYSPTMYVRYSKNPRSPILHPRNNDNSPTRSLEKLLAAFGCKDRFWDDTAGADQPDGACGLPNHITVAQRTHKAKQEREEETARQRRDEETRIVAEQRRLQVQREQEEAERERERQQWEERRAEQRAEAAEETAREHARMQASRAAREAEFESDRRRIKALAKEGEDSERRRAKIRADGARAEASIEKGVIREKQKLLDSFMDAAVMANAAGVGGQMQIGRVLGELEY